MGEHRLAPSGEGTVVLELGRDVGAIVLHVPPELDGTEIDLFELDSPDPLTHSAVRRRDVAGTSLYAAVYPGVATGRYRLAGHAQAVAVSGGRVTEVLLEAGSC